MKLIYSAKEAWEEAYIKRSLPEVEVEAFVGPLEAHPERDEEVELLSVFVDSPVGERELARYPKLRLIATRSTGFDHIDLPAAAARGIAVASVPSYGVNTVAEFAFALILALSRKICEARARVREGSFSQEDLTGFDLAGKTLGIVGCGHIGVHTATIARGFGMQVLVHDTSRDEALATRIGFAYAELDELLSRSDIVSLHIPYNEHTHHLLNAGNIGRMKKGAYLINTSRGAIVETDALVEALKNGTIGGAGLDVLEEEGDMNDELRLLIEPHPKEEALKVVLENHYLMEHPRVIVTPHMAFDTREAIERIIDTTAENITAFLRGTPQNIVTQGNL